MAYRKIYFKVGILSVIIFILFSFVIKIIKSTYWIGWAIDKPQTIWAKLIDKYSLWWKSFPSETYLVTGFILGMILAMILSICMEEK